MELTADGGGKVPALINSGLSGRVPGVSVSRVEVNGGPGALLLDAQQRLIAVIALDINGGQITSINSIVNPDKLTHLRQGIGAR